MDYRAIPAQLEGHREALVGLWRRNFASDRMEECADRRYTWLYGTNPFGRPHTWLALESETDAVVGCASVVPLNKYVDGRTVRTGVAVDFAVDEQHRNAWAALAIQRAVTRGSARAGCDCVLGLPNRQAFPIFRLVGYRQIGDATNWVKSLETHSSEPPAIVHPYVEDIVAVADERFDELWSAHKPQSLILTEKTAAYLNWRYASFVEQTYRFYCLVRRGDDRLVGYLAFTTMDNGALIADLFAEDLFGPALRDLLLGFASRMKAEGREWIGLSYVGAACLEEQLTQLGFVPRKRTRSLLAFVDPQIQNDLAQQILDKERSVVFGGEMDLF